MPEPAAQNPNPPCVAGIDGCRGGWIVVLAEGRNLQSLRFELAVCASFHEVLGVTERAAWSAIDLPIGLLKYPQPGGRACDQEARRVLAARRSTVFSPPARPLLAFTSFDAMRAAVPHHGMSLQCFNLFPKIREVDEAMTPALQQRMHEAHPELAFLRLQGGPVSGKHGAAGVAQRKRLLDGVSPEFTRALQLGLNRYPRRLVKPDDLLDALALVLTAWHGFSGTGLRLPQSPDRDLRGLAMEICY